MRSRRVWIAALALAAAGGCSSRNLSVGDGVPTLWPVSRVSYLRDGGIVVAGTEVLLFYDRHLTNPRKVSVPTRSDKEARYTAVSTDGLIAFVAWSDWDIPATEIDVFRVGGERLSRLALPGQIRAAALSPGGQRLVVEGAGLSVSTTTAFSADGTRTWANDGLRSPFVFASDGVRLYAGVGDGQSYGSDPLGFAGVDARTGQVAVTFGSPGISLNVSPDGRRLVVTNGGVAAAGVTWVAEVWSTGDGVLEQRMPVQPGFSTYSELAVGDDGAVAALGHTTNPDGSPQTDSPLMVQVWDRTGALRFRQPLARPDLANYWVAFSPDGTEILAAVSATQYGGVSVHVMRATDGVNLAELTLSSRELRP